VEQTGETLNAIIRTAVDAIVVANSDGVIVSWNPAAERIFGRSEDEAIGRSLTIIIPDRYHDAHLAGIERVRSGGEHHVIGSTVELAGVRSDGTEFPLELSLATWVSDGDTYFAGILRDVSERAELMAALSASEARLQAVLGSATDAIIVADVQRNVVMWNPGATEMFGYKPDEIVGRPVDVIMPEHERDAALAVLGRLASGNEDYVVGSTIELAGLRRDGTEFPVELSLATWEAGGESYFSGIIRDITDRKEAEAALGEKNEQLEALSSKLAKYLSRQVYDSIFSGRQDVRVESYRKKLTVFFSDIQGFTELTDRMEAESISELLNNYLSEMSRIAGEHGGTVDKFMGDGIMIFFGDPETLGEQDDAIACCRMALAMRHRIEELKHEWGRVAGGVELHVRMGINTGYCTVGNFGSDDRLDYTIVGKEVNLASRLETAAAADQILIANDTYGLVSDEFDCRPVGEMNVRGMAYPVRTYEVVGLPHDHRAHSVVAHAGSFDLELDPDRLAPNEVAAAKEALQQALEALETDDSQNES
jgi:adenylate cyclase